MTIAVVQDFDGASLDHYDRAINKMGITPGDKHPDPGCLFHWAAQTSDGLRVVDVWETREQFDNFVEAQVVPAAIEAEFPNLPRNTVYDVHAYFK